MAFHPEVLSTKTQKVFVLLSDVLRNNFYLGGGTGLALRIGHRISYDLDFFAPKHFNESQMIQKLSARGQFQLEDKSEQTVIGILNDVKVSFLGYQYPLLSPLHKFNKIMIAGVLDIACMKIDAIASRGAKRDFIDVYFVAKEVMPLPEILDKFKKKYATLHYNLIHIKKSLVYFQDADHDPLPSMLKSVDWKEVKEFFIQEIMKN